MLDRLARLLFLLGTVFMALIWGVASAEQGVFPYPWLREAVAALREAKTYVALQLRPADLENHPHVARSTDLGRTFADPEPKRGWTLVSLFDGGGFAVVLLDATGRPVHRWVLPEAAHELLATRDWSLRAGHQQITGTHLDEAGNLVAVVYDNATMKLDACGNLLWARLGGYHHDIEPLPDGGFLVLEREIVTEGLAGREGFATPYWEDAVVRLDPEGRVLERHPIIEMFLNSPYRGALLEGETPGFASDDPTHANDIDVIGEGFARHHPDIEAGDWLLSLRAIDTVAVVDRATKRVAWALSGRTLRQHDPDARPDGTLMVFDNNAFAHRTMMEGHPTPSPRYGPSRVLRLEPMTGRELWSYAGTPETPFFTSVAGDQQALPNGNVLISDTEAGRVFEVAPKQDNRIVWAYRNVLRDDGEALWVGRVTEARRYSKGALDPSTFPCAAEPQAALGNAP